MTVTAKDIRLAKDMLEIEHMVPLSGKDLADAIAKFEEESKKRKELLARGGNGKDNA